MNLNPDSVILQKLAALILWKCAGTSKVTITAEDMRAMADNFAPGMACVLTHGKAESIEFSLVTEAEAVRMAEFDRQTRSKT